MAEAAATDVPQIADEDLASLIRAEVDRRWPSTSSGLEEVMRYGLLPFGKVLGPWLLLQACQAVGGRTAEVLPAALAVECIQVGAMMHDDMIDTDHLRRGKQAAHAHYGQHTAMVGGDGLFFGGFAALADCRAAGAAPERVSAALEVMARAGLRIGSAAVREIQLSHTICSTEHYLEMIRDKSGALLWMATGVGATLAGGDDRSLTALQEFSDLLGMAYQIRDDLMAYDGTRAGKPNVSDVRNGRPTLPVLLAHHNASPGERRHIQDLLTDTAMPAEDRHRELGHLITAVGADDAARHISRRYARSAADHLRQLPASPHRDALQTLTVPGRLI
jgi:geranylgeranyl pyrophosphate synthase